MKGLVGATVYELKLLVVTARLGLDLSKSTSLVRGPLADEARS